MKGCRHLLVVEVTSIVKRWGRPLLRLTEAFEAQAGLRGSGAANKSSVKKPV